MESESELSSVEAAHERQVPEELLRKLHEATERFHQAKKTLDESISSSEFSHQQTVDKATEELRLAERQVEEISLRIHSALKPAPPATPSH